MSRGGGCPKGEGGGTEAPEASSPDINWSEAIPLSESAAEADWWLSEAQMPSSEGPCLAFADRPNLRRRLSGLERREKLCSSAASDFSAA